MKLVIQVPCLNEAETLPLVFEHMPRQHSRESMSSTSSSSTTAPATTPWRWPGELGVRHFVHHIRNMGLGQSFHDGTLKALEMGADIVVNTDGDNQYPSERIPDLIQPILDGRADIVIADRQTHTIEHFSPVKKLLQRLGSRVVNAAAGTERAGCGQRVSGLLAGGLAAPQHGDPVQLLHGDHHPGRQQAPGHRQHSGRDEPEDQGVPTLQVHGRARGEIGHHHHPGLHHVQADDAVPRCRSSSSSWPPSSRLSGF